MSNAEALLARKRYFNLFALSNLSAMRVLRLFGLLRQEDEDRDHKAWGMLAGEARSFRNIAEHCLVVGLIADIILERLVETGSINETWRRLGRRAALLHDADKRHELGLIYGVEVAVSKDLKPPQLKQALSKLPERLTLYPEDARCFRLARLSGGSFYTTPLDEVVITDAPKCIVEWVVFLADHMAAHTKVVSAEQRTEEILRRQEYGALVDWRYRKLFGDQDFPDEPAERYKRLYAHVMEMVRKVEVALMERLEIGRFVLGKYVKFRIQARIDSLAQK